MPRRSTRLGAALALALIVGIGCKTEEPSPSTGEADAAAAKTRTVLRTDIPRPDGVTLDEPAAVVVLVEGAPRVRSRGGKEFPAAFGHALGSADVLVAPEGATVVVLLDNGNLVRVDEEDVVATVSEFAFLYAKPASDSILEQLSDLLSKKELERAGGEGFATKITAFQVEVANEGPAPETKEAPPPEPKAPEVTAPAETGGAAQAETDAETTDAEAAPGTGEVAETDGAADTGEAADTGAKVEPKGGKKPAEPKVNAAPLFLAKCKGCHGADGKAETSIGKKENIPSLVGTKLSKGKLADVIANGVPGTKMKAFGDKLDAAEIKALAAYIKGTLARGPKSGKAKDPEASEPKTPEASEPKEPEATARKPITWAIHSGGDSDGAKGPLPEVIRNRRAKLREIVDAVVKSHPNLPEVVRVVMRVDTGTITKAAIDGVHDTPKELVETFVGKPIPEVEGKLWIVVKVPR
ncbi:MAG: cytochrome c [Nannocystaceae bacterium]|nr:cytochrome c [Myxococcales bacterium]